MCRDMPTIAGSERVEPHKQILLGLEDIRVHFKLADFHASDLKKHMLEWLLIHILKEDILIGEFTRKNDPTCID